MIDTKDLRIGNWVDIIDNNKTGKYRMAIDLCNLNDIDSSNYSAKGIELTEEILLKAGFEKKLFKGIEWREFYVIKINHQHYGFILGKKEYEITNPNKGILVIHHPFEKNVPCPTEDNLNNVMDWEEKNYHFAWHIAYLHHLQNLIHAITEEELEINL